MRSFRSQGTGSPSQKVPLAQSMQAFFDAKQNAFKNIQPLSLPCSVVAVDGKIVTVKFLVAGIDIPNVDCPIMAYEYFQPPVQIGDEGLCLSANASLGSVSGLSDADQAVGISTFNLSSLVFAPVSRMAWSDEKPDNAIVKGPGGVIIKDIDGNAIINVDKQSGISMNFGGHSVVINATGVLIDGIDFATHKHSAGLYLDSFGRPVTGTSGEVSPI